MCVRECVYERERTFNLYVYILSSFLSILNYKNIEKSLFPISEAISFNILLRHIIEF